MTTIVLSRADLAAIARSNHGGDFRGIRELRFTIDEDGCVADCNAVVVGRRENFDGANLSRAADIALARWDRQGQPGKVIPFRRAVA